MRVLKALFAVLAVGLLAAGCLPVTTKVPVGTTKGFAADPALVGTWQIVPEPGKAENGTGYLHILASGDGGMTAILANPGNAKSSGDFSIYALTVTQLGANRLINARIAYSGNGVASAAEAAASFPLLYRFDGKRRLKLYLIDEAAAKAAVKAGVIDGTIGPGDNGDVVITADAAKLDAFFASAAGAALFSGPVLRGVKAD